MPIRISLYLNSLGVNGVVRLTSHWKERQSGFQEEVTTEEIVCLRKEQYLRMTVVWTQKLFEILSTTPRIETEAPISREEYEKICQENGGILDTPELVQANDQLRALERQLYELVPACPKCGTPMTARSGKRGDFWGCTRYPKCKGTLSWDDNLAAQREAIYKELEKYQNV